MNARVDTGTALRVLIVEHDKADAELNVFELQRAGYTVHTDLAATPAEFLALLKRHEHDIVLADYRMPGWTGMEALALVKEGGYDIPLILVTGTLGDERAVDCLHLGAADYVLKQNLSRLQTAVPRALEECRQRRQMLQSAQRTREAEAVVRESAERFRQLADSVSEVFFVMDSEYRETLYINPAYEKTWGKTCQSLYDDPKSFVQSVLPEDRDMVLRDIARIVRGGSPQQVDFRIKRPDGAVRWISATTVPIRDEKGNVYRLSGVARDITERLEARLALEESVARYEKLTEASFDAIGIVQDGVIKEANAGFVRLFGYDRLDEIIGRSPADFVTEKSRGELAMRERNGIDGSAELEGLRKDGKTFLLEVMSKMHNIDGKPARLTALRDITERRSLEAQFRQAQKMEAVGRLAGGVAHDFNNLLTVIIGHSQLMLAELLPSDPRRDDLDQILKAGYAAESLTRQLLTFSRREVVAPRILALGEVVAQTRKMLGHLIGEDIEVIMALTSKDCAVEIDPGQLEQIVMNLAVNARDAMPTGGILELKTDVVELDDRAARALSLDGPGRFATLVVADNGTGMDAETRGRIFEPFFTTKGPGRGTGLGLATVHGIVHQSSGSIAVATQPGAGTTFTIYLPLVSGARAAASEVLATAESPRGAETVLLVEDSPQVREIALRTLRRQGYAVLQAASGSAALAIARRSNLTIALLLTDVVMPLMSGRVLAELFADLHPMAKVLYMSGYTDDAVVRHGVLRAGMPYLQKPFTPHVLACKVREVLDAPQSPVGNTELALTT